MQSEKTGLKPENDGRSVDFGFFFSDGIGFMGETKEKGKKDNSSFPLFCGGGVGCNEGACTAHRFPHGKKLEAIYFASLKCGAAEICF